MKFEIKTVKNGLILIAEYDDDEKADADELVFSEEYETTEEDPDGVECFADFLRLIADHYGPSTGRYSLKRIHVDVVPGDKTKEYEKYLKEQRAWFSEDDNDYGETKIEVDE